MANKLEQIFKLKIEGLDDVEKFKDIILLLKETLGKNRNLTFNEASPYYKEVKRLYEEMVENVYPDMKATEEHVKQLITDRKPNDKIREHNYPFQSIRLGGDAILNQIEEAEQSTVQIEDYSNRKIDIKSGKEKLQEQLQGLLLEGLINDKLPENIADNVSELQDVLDILDIDYNDPEANTIFWDTVMEKIITANKYAKLSTEGINLLRNVIKTYEEEATFESAFGKETFLMFDEFRAHNEKHYNDTKQFLDDYTSLEDNAKDEILAIMRRQIDVKTQFYIKEAELKKKYNQDQDFSIWQGVARGRFFSNQLEQYQKYLKDRNELKAKYDRDIERSNLKLSKIYAVTPITPDFNKIVGEKTKINKDNTQINSNEIQPQILPERNKPQTFIFKGDGTIEVENGYLNEDTQKKTSEFPNSPLGVSTKNIQDYLRFAPIPAPVVDKSSLLEAKPFVSHPDFSPINNLIPPGSVNLEEKKKNTEESSKLDQEYNETYQEGLQENQTANQTFQESVMENTEERKEAYQQETAMLDEQKEQRIGILAQIGEAYADNTSNVKDAFAAITGLFKGNDPIVDGMLGFAEKNLPKLLGLFQKTNKEINEDVKDSTDKRNDIVEEGMEKTKEITEGSLSSIQEHVQLVIDAIGMVFEAMNESLDKKKEEAQERYEALSEKYDEVTEKVEKSNARIATLHEEAKNAQGGRAMIIQEELSREIESNKELANEQKRLANEKQKAEAEIEKAETQKKKNELKQQLLQTIANTAFGVAKAVSGSPFSFGLPWSAFVALTGAIQAATITKQLSKLADGGLLGGKPHTQGGMRIEGTNIEVEGGEYVVNRASTRKNLGLVSYINSQRRELTPADINGYFGNTGGYGESPNFKTMFASGGVLPSEDIMNTYQTDAAVQAIESINLQPVVSVVDIANVQKNLTTVTDWTNTSSF